jgi:hypothetical protein
MAIMVPIGSSTACSSGLVHGFTALMGLWVMWIIAMTRVMDIEDRCRRVVRNRSITFMEMRRGTGGATSLLSRIMILATNIALVTQAAGVPANIDNLASVTRAICRHRCRLLVSKNSEKALLARFSARSLAALGRRRGTFSVSVTSSVLYPERPIDSAKYRGGLLGLIPENAGRGRYNRMGIGS